MSQSRQTTPSAPGESLSPLAVIALIALAALGLVIIVITGLALATAKLFDTPLAHASLGKLWRYVSGHLSHPIAGSTTSSVIFYSASTVASVAVVIVAARVARPLIRYVERQSGISDGFATAEEIRKHASAPAAVEKGNQTRPDLASNDTGDVTEYGYSLGYIRGTPRQTITASFEASLLLVGPPGCGKTTRCLLPILRNFPGPVLATSTKVDLYEASAIRRQEKGPVWVLDPEAMTEGAPLIRWSPTRGCEDTHTAERRAKALIAGASSQNSDTRNAFFEVSATAVLRVLLHAAALGDNDISDVLRWCRGEYTQALSILREHADPMLNMAGELTIHTTGADVTTSGVMRMVENALGCFNHRRVIEMCTPSIYDDFDIAEFLRTNGTVYVLGGSASTSTALTTLFAEELLYVAGTVVAPHTPYRRLVPPLLACLDEAPNIAPLPSLPHLLADGRGRGIVTLVAMQSFSQARSRWSANEAETMSNAATITAVYGGLSVGEDLARLERLCGTHLVASHSSSQSMQARRSISASWRSEPVLRADEIRTLDTGEMLVLFDHLPPMIAYTPSIYEIEREDIKREIEEIRTKPLGAKHKLVVNKVW